MVPTEVKYLDDLDLIFLRLKTDSGAQEKATSGDDIRKGFQALMKSIANNKLVQVNLHHAKATSTLIER